LGGPVAEIAQIRREQVERDGGLFLIG